MKGITGAILVAAAGAVLISGCAKPRAAARDGSPSDIIQEQANAITSAGGLAAVGMGVSRTVHHALEKAKLRGRGQLQHVLESKIDTMRQAFIAEIGEGEDSEYNALFTAASDSLASQILRGTMPSDFKYDTTGGMTSAWALMVLDPKVIADAFAAQADTARHQYTRFLASQAFEELEQEIKTFAAFQKQD